MNDTCANYRHCEERSDAAVQYLSAYAALSRPTRFIIWDATIREGGGL
jgi:hypothetical protein